MPAYWVARSKINDPVEYRKYTDRVPAIIAKHGGKVLARGGRYQVMEGPKKFQRFVVIEFPTFEQGVACFTSPEYEAAAAFRRGGAGEVETIIVESGDATPRFHEKAHAREPRRARSRPGPRGLCPPDHRHRSRHDAAARRARRLARRQLGRLSAQRDRFGGEPPASDPRRLAQAMLAPMAGTIHPQGCSG